MARVSEFEQRQQDTLEIAISQDEYDRLGDPVDPFELRITILDDNGDELGSYLLSDDPADWSFDADTNEWYLLDSQSNSFGNHRTNWDGFVLSSTNPSGLDTVEDAFMVAPWNEPADTDGPLATTVASATHIPVGTELTFIDQEGATGTGPGATLRFDAPDIDTPIVSTDDDLGNTGSAPPICFVAGTEVTCRDGPRRVEDLRPGDLVLTLSGQFKAVRWIGKQEVSARQLRDDPRKRPVRIKAGSLGGQKPSTDLLLSRQHRVAIACDSGPGKWAKQTVLIAAHRLTALRGISLVCPKHQITYFHILLAEHEVVFANNLECETLFLGVEALKLMKRQSLLEIEELVFSGFSQAPALPVPSGTEQKGIVDHLSRKSPFVAAIDAHR